MNPIKRLKNLKVLCAITTNAMMILQIILIIMLLLLSAYAFFGLMKVTLLDFLTPFVDVIKGFVHTIFGDSIKAAQPEIDGDIIAFIIAEVLAIFLIAQVRLACTFYDKKIDKAIVDEKDKLEHKFNQELSDELQRNIASYNNYMLGVYFRVTPLVVDAFQIYGEDKIDVQALTTEIIEKFLKSVETIKGVKVTQDKYIVKIVSRRFENIDLVVSSVMDIIARLRKEYKARKVALKVRFAVETYTNGTPENKAFAAIKPLLELNMSTDVLCYGNFHSRYTQLETQQYYVVVKGKYDIYGSEDTIYGMVKKD